MAQAAVRHALTAALAAAVAVAFADSSIVVLALPDLYGELETSIVGVSWVITAYNVAVAVCALALVPAVGRLRTLPLLAAGLAVFLGASIACGLAGDLPSLIAARSCQGLGGALLLAGALPALGALTGSAARGAAAWTVAGTLGAALGPALGGALTQAFDWRSIFYAQAPVAGLALIAAFAVRVRVPPPVRTSGPLRATGAANLGLALVFGALVGALFLAVLLLITVWGHSPLAGAGVVSVLPAATLAVRPLSARLPGGADVAGGALLLALGLAALALLPGSSVAVAAPALALCGAGLGLSVPTLTRAALRHGPELARSGTLTIGVRHLGLVLALVIVAPLLADRLEAAGERAMLNATAVVLDGPIPLSAKIPIALDMRREFVQARQGEVPDLRGPFERHGAGDDPRLAGLRDNLLAAIEAPITRAFRPAFWVCALLAAAALAPALVRPGRRAP